MIRRGRLTALLVFACASASGAGTSPAPDTRRVVLPPTVTPNHYRIDVQPDAAALTFRGSVEIDVTVHRATDRIVLNSADLVIDQAVLASAAPAAGSRTLAVSYDPSVETATLRAARRIKPGGFTLRLDYHGRIFQNASGLFALDYETPQGKARALFTQFENSDARRFVPSWDEPARKATFALTATVPAQSMALSNMPIAAVETLPNDRIRVHFATTPRMSSYLLFFGDGDFERVHRDVQGVDVGVIVKRGDTAQAAFALDAASAILPYYNEYFGIPFPLPKLDLIAAPGTSQFFGAMENWGAIFFFERDLLVNERFSTEADRQQVYITTAHEMAHQWFGDLVTMSWWDDLWLNEGFASWMENKVTNQFHPEWNVWLQALDDKQHAMQQDARDGTHPIITPIHDVLQASGAFDTITYSKGAAVIRMLESYLGEAAFRAGVRRYMQRYAYGNTVTDDLWREMDRGAPRPILRIAHDFTLQAGVPMLTETSDACRDGDTPVRLAQDHFAIDPDSTSARTWHVPATLRTFAETPKAPGSPGSPGSLAAAAPPMTAVVTGESPQRVTVGGCGTLILNAGQTGYFRSRYTPAAFDALAVRFASLAADDQLGVLNDGSSLALAGEQPLVPLLDLIRSFPVQSDPVVAAALVDLLQELDRVYDGLPTQAAFRAFARSVLEPIFARVGWKAQAGEGVNEPLLRQSLTVALGDFGDAPVLAEARVRFERYRADPSALDAAARRTVLAIVASNADPLIWSELHEMAKSARTELEREQLYDRLADAQDPLLARQALELALSGEPPPTVAPEIIGAASRRHPQLALDFTVAHWDALDPLLEPSNKADFAPDLLRHASDPDLIGKLNAFAATHIPPSGRQGVRKAEASVRYFAMIRRQRLPEIDRWLLSHLH
jgi:aminopeptidase N